MDDRKLAAVREEMEVQNEHLRGYLFSALHELEPGVWVLRTLVVDSGQFAEAPAEAWYDSLMAMAEADPKFLGGRGIDLVDAERQAEAEVFPHKAKDE